MPLDDAAGRVEDYQGLPCGLIDFGRAVDQAQRRPVAGVACSPSVPTPSTSSDRDDPFDDEFAFPRHPRRRFECRLGDAAWALCGSPTTLQNLPRARPRTFSVRGVRPKGSKT